MKTTHQSLIALALFGALSAGALAQTSAVDPAQLRAETAAAVAAGTIARGELLFADPAVAGSRRSLADVRAETRAALAEGMVAHGEAGAPIEPFESMRTRAEVKAETLAAIRLHLIPHGEAPVVVPSAQQGIRLAAK